MFFRAVLADEILMRTVYSTTSILVYKPLLLRMLKQVGELVGACRTSDFTDMIIVQETRGEPDGLIVCHLPLGPTAYFTLSNCVLRHDIADRGTMSEVYPHLIFDKFTTSLGKRIADVLKFLFPVPKVYMS